MNRQLIFFDFQSQLASIIVGLHLSHRGFAFKLGSGNVTNSFLCVFFELGNRSLLRKFFKDNKLALLNIQVDFRFADFDSRLLKSIQVGVATTSLVSHLLILFLSQ